MNETKRKPTHPGEVLLEDVIKPMNLSITHAAECLGVSRKTLSEIVNGKCAVSPDMAVRIGVATGTTPESWLEMQNRLSIWEAKQRKPQVKRFAGESCHA